MAWGGAGARPAARPPTVHRATPVQRMSSENRPTQRPVLHLVFCSEDGHPPPPPPPHWNKQHVRRRYPPPLLPFQVT